MIEISDVGKMVKCPNCGEIGKVGIEKVSVKGKIYQNPMPTPALFNR